MNYNKRCGYQGHVCNGTKFISRYRDENDYCVDGDRIGLTDAGQWSRLETPEQKFRVQMFLLKEYADYIRWHVENKARLGLGELSPFDHSAAFHN